MVVSKVQLISKILFYHEYDYNRDLAKEKIRYKVYSSIVFSDSMYPNYMCTPGSVRTLFLRSLELTEKLINYLLLHSRG